MNIEKNALFAVEMHLKCFIYSAFPPTNTFQSPFTNKENKYEIAMY